ncbi:WUSCHEL- homeobox 8 [Turnera subulata]|uniref:WUSCHEL- homeobox 8 n=1 Tax=Turnera subulata TaxID=218843 RepID=A0A9Q0JSQ8_9ROSI|nr:WUSCHEL- homeobox 8 [Turnera subulata]
MEEGKCEIDGLGAKLMTDEQMEMLRKQISVYATICDLLVQKHKELSSKPELAGVRLGNPYCDPLFPSGVHKIPSRQRWTPKPEQLEILERLFEQCNATPCRQKIKDITAELAQHGQVSETNIYNWFQNRRARSKRKQQAAESNLGEAEADTKVESAKNKMTKPEDIQPDETSQPLTDYINMYIQSPDIGFDQFGKIEAPGSYNPFWQMEQYPMFG